MLILRLALLIGCALLAGAQELDMAIVNGRVIDPETHNFFLRNRAPNEC